MTNDIQVVDNFLPDDVFIGFATMVMQSDIYQPCDYSTFFSESDGSISTFGENLTPDKSLAELMFQAVIFGVTVSSATVHHLYLGSPVFFKKLEEHLNVKRWIVIRSNCTVGQAKPHTGTYHVDFFDRTLRNHDQTKTSILYLNTNNGGTKFRDSGQFVQSKKNRLVTFPTPTYHAGVWATDAKLRFVLNMTYETN